MKLLAAYSFGRVFIKLTITPSGSVQQVTILKALYEPFDLAVVKAARQLRFGPRPVQEGAVSFTVGISFEKEVDWLIAHQHPAAHQTTPRRNSTP